MTPKEISIKLIEFYSHYSSNPLENIGLLVKILGESLQATSAVYNRLESNLLHAVGKYEIPGDYMILDNPQGHVCYDVIRKNDDNPVYIRDLKSTKYYETDPNIRKYNLVTYLGTAVKWQGKAIGTLCVLFNEETEVSDARINFLKILASILSTEEDRRQSRQTIIEAENLYQTLFQASPSGIMLESTDGKIIDVNETLCNFLGYSKDELIKMNVRQLVPVNLHGEVSRNIEKILNGSVLDHEVINVRKDGILRYFTLRETLFTLPGGDKGILVLANDITERKEAELILQESEERLRTLINSTPDVIYFKDGEGRYQVANDAAIRLYELEMVNYKGKTDSMLGMIKEDYKEIFNYSSITDDLAWRNRKPLKTEVTIVKPNKETYIFESLKVPLFNTDGSRKALIVIARDITNRKQSEKELQDSEEKYRGLVESIDEVIFTLDPEGYFTYISPAVERIFGFKVEAVIGRHFSEFIYPEDLKSVSDSFNRVMSGLIEPTEYRVRNNKGGFRYVRSSSRRIAENGKDVVLKGILIDMTDKILIENELRKSKEAAESSTKIKSEFLATMSHEIRTPMNGVIGMTSLLMQTQLDNEQKEYINTIRNSGETLLTVINDILDFSKIESGNIILENEPFFVKSCIEEMIDLFSVTAEDKSIKLSYSIEKDVPASITSDISRIRQLLSNLISNALKFTEKGEIKINVKLNEETNNKLLLEFCVSDTGIGIEKKYIPKLFKPFSQVDSSTTRKFGGTGLGLTICKQLVELMGGNIWVESRIGAGSSFYFTIIAEKNEITEKEEKKIDREELDFNLSIKIPLKILLAEDNIVNQKVGVKILNKFGYRPEVALNGLEAIEALKIQKFDLIFMDIQMPEMDGYEATRRILKMYTPGEGPKIIAMTAAVMKGDKEKCLESGMIDYIAKPILPEDVQGVIKKWFK